jgi:hypothetical protein
MRPAFSSHDAADLRRMKAELRCQLNCPHARRSQSDNFYRLRVCNLCSTVILALRLSVLADHISSVFDNRPQLEMLWIYARRVIAFVHDDLAFDAF